MIVNKTPKPFPWFGRSGHVLVLLLFTSFCLQAPINVVTLPDRDSVQLTIYNSVDPTLDKETRVLTLRLLFAIP